MIGKSHILFFILLFFCLRETLQAQANPDWQLINQLNYPRVFEAAIQSDSALEELFLANDLNYPPNFIYWRAFKLEKELELWAKDSAHHPFTLLKTYNIFKTCGDLGPKRKQGDMQIPEGFYHVSKFNPMSWYYLSFKINYPNKSDSFFAHPKNPGGDIFIHGDTQTIGCLPMTDSMIKEIYWLTVLTQNRLDSGQTIPFHIYPTRLETANWQYLYEQYWGDQNKIRFWNSLQGVYNYFKEEKILPEITTDDKGYYKVVYPKRTAYGTKTNELPDSRPGQSGQ
jgi:murein L,D-transpeptidase YafK